MNSVPFLLHFLGHQEARKPLNSLLLTGFTGGTGMGAPTSYASIPPGTRWREPHTTDLRLHGIARVARRGHLLFTAADGTFQPRTALLRRLESAFRRGSGHGLHELGAAEVGTVPRILQLLARFRRAAGHDDLHHPIFDAHYAPILAPAFDELEDPSASALSMRWPSQRRPEDPQGTGGSGRGCPAAERTQDSIEHQVEFPPHVFRQNTKDEVVALLKELVLASVPSVRCSVREMLGAVQFDRDARIGAEQVDLQPTLAVEWNWERDVETKSPLGFRERLEPPEKERLGRTPRSIHTVTRSSTTPFLTRL